MNTTIHKGTFHSLEAIIDHLYVNEKGHYGANGKPDDHIFKHIKRVDRWMQKVARDHKL